MKISKAQQRALKAQAHSLKPVVLLGQKGLTDQVIAEIELALNYHELIKVKIAGAEKAGRVEIAAEICRRTNADLIGLIGQIAILYRETEEGK